MANNNRLSTEIPETLFIEFNESRRLSQKNYSNLLLELTKTPRPKNFQASYKPFYDGEITKKLDLRVSDEARVAFCTFAAVFRNYHHTLDYLIFTEKSRKIGRASN